MLSDRAFNPDYDTVLRLFRKYRETALGSRNGKSMFERLRSMRVHEKVPQARELCYMDASASFEHLNMSITLLYTSCAVGALPLGLFITSDELGITLEKAINLLKTILPGYAFFGHGPQNAPGRSQGIGFLFLKGTNYNQTPNTFTPYLAVSLGLSLLSTIFSPCPEVKNSYFNRKSAEWDIIGFLDEDKEKVPLEQKLDSYIKDLRVLANIEQGKRQEKAQLLIADRQRAKEWYTSTRTASNRPSVNFHNSKVGVAIIGISSGVNKECGIGLEKRPRSVIHDESDSDDSPCDSAKRRLTRELRKEVKKNELQTSVSESDVDEDDESDVTGIVPQSKWFINEIDVSERWHQFKQRSLKLAMEKGLFAESHTQEILSLSHVLLLKPKQHSSLMMVVFSTELLEMMHKDMLERFTEQETEFDFEIFTKLTLIVKQLRKGKVTRNIAVTELQTLMIGRSYGEVSILKAIKNIIERVPTITLSSPLGEVELCTTYIDPVLSPIIADPDQNCRSNKEAPESKARKLTGRAKQSDAIINNIEQLSWGSSMGHGEAKVKEEANNLYSLSADLIRVAVFNKDGIDFYKMRCMFGFQVVGQHISFYLTTLLCDGLYVMAEIGHLDVPMSLEQIPAFLSSLDTLLITTNAYWANCQKSNAAVEIESNKRNTLATPNFKELIASSRDRHRP
ncbi:3688_t:CDS:10, partial [Paraglomus occultum]